MRKAIYAALHLILLLPSTIYLSYLTYRGGIVAGQALYFYILLLFLAIVALVMTKTTMAINKVKGLSVFIITVVLYALNLVFSPIENANATKFFALLIINGLTYSLFAICISQRNLDKKVFDTILPFLLFPLMIIIGKTAISFSVERAMFDEEIALNYQNISYAIAEIYALFGYYYFFSSNRDSRTFKILKYPSLIAMPVCIAICLISGGRGGFIYLISVSLLLYLLRIDGRLSLSSLCLIVIVLAILYQIMIRFNVSDTRGFERIFQGLNDTSTRELFYKLARSYINESPLFGHGVGSVFTTVGFYCHNIFYDIAVEMGLIGIAIFLYILKNIFVTLYHFIHQDQFYIVISVVFLKALIMSFVSGYWLSVGMFWFVITLCFLYPKKFRNGSMMGKQRSVA